MKAGTKTAETPEQREKLLSALKPRDRNFIQELMADHPGLTAAEAIEHTVEMGGLSLSGTDVREMLLLSALKPGDRKRVEETMEVYPNLTAAEAIEMLTAFGGL